MLKPLLFILAIVIALAIWVNSDAYNMRSTPITISTVEPSKSSTTTKESLKQERQIFVTKPSVEKSVDNEALYKEIDKLFEEASHYFQKSLDDEAQELYNQIINKIGDSQDLKLLQFFARAYFQQALIHQLYPNNDKDSAIEAYNKVIKKFEKSDDKALLMLYMDARIKQAYLFEEDERIEVYDELIQKFKNYKEQNFQTEIEELLFSQSYALMGKNDDEAMRILDTIINKYDTDNATSLPHNIQVSLLNTLELSIITNSDDTKYKELADKYLVDSPDKKPLIAMLDIIRNAQDLNQDEALNDWIEAYKDYHFADWSFQELKRWNDQMEDIGTKKRVAKYIKAFEEHKYKSYISNNNTQEGNQVIYTPDPYDSNTIYSDPYSTEKGTYAPNITEDLY